MLEAPVLMVGTDATVVEAELVGGCWAVRVVLGCSARGGSPAGGYCDAVALRSW